MKSTALCPAFLVNPDDGWLPPLLGLRSHKPLDVAPPPPPAAAAATTGPWDPQVVEPSGVSSLAPLSTSVALGFARDAYVESMGLWGITYP